MTRFYVLAAEAPRQPTTSKTGVNVGLRTIFIPEYLHSRRMVVRRGENEIIYTEFERWAEPLRDGIARVLRESLEQSPGIRSVSLEPWETSPDFEVEIRIGMCEGAVDSQRNPSARFSAKWKVIGKSARRAGHFDPAPVPWDGKSFSSLAGIISKSVAGLGLEVAKEVSGEPGN